MSTNPMTIPSPCPHCGAETDHIESGPGYRVRHQKCGTSRNMSGEVRFRGDACYEREIAALRSARWSPQCPWPADVWTMTEDAYVRAVPDPDTRTAISGFLMRKGWEAAVEDYGRAEGGAAPIWRQKPPDVPGWWWHKWNGADICVVRVTEWMGKLWCGKSMIEKMAPRQWSGPIQEPQPETTETK